MKDMHKYSVYIYIIVPILVAIWPALILTMYMPTAEAKLSDDIEAYSDANNKMLDILSLEPERIEFGDPNEETIEFAYDRVVDQIASSCKIPPSKCKLSTGTIIDSKSSKTQTASVRLSNVDITKFAKFLSDIQSRWPNLVCNSVKLNKKENIPDEWDVLIDFKYFYSATD
ncbi:MAG: hypothetical protein JXA96_02280 [Sedimentisphaerales bacterium]|nr:hypothetical protein [Sedimentisphaerales bacterium]